MYALKRILLFMCTLNTICDSDTSTNLVSAHVIRKCSNYPQLVSCRTGFVDLLPYYHSGSCCCYYLRDTWQCVSSFALYHNSLLRCFHELIPHANSNITTLCCDNPPYVSAYAYNGAMIDKYNDENCSSKMSFYTAGNSELDNGCQTLRVRPPI